MELEIKKKMVGTMKPDDPLRKHKVTDQKSN